MRIEETTNRSLRHELSAHIRFFGDYVKANFLSALEYRVTFISQLFGMLLNDAMWIVFWWIYFTKFQVIGQGWRMEDMLALWATAGVAFGLSVACFGNLLRLAQMISQGDLDYYLALPKNVLMHVLVSRMEINAWSDLLFGTGLFVIFVHPGIGQIALFLGLSLCAAVVFLSATLIWQSLAFWLGNAEGLAAQMWNAMILFGTYPTPLFQGAVKVVIFTALPAAFMTHVPAQLLRRFDLTWFIAEIGIAVGTLALAIWIFYRGLRRYESGNLMLMRS